MTIWFSLSGIRLQRLIAAGNIVETQDTRHDVQH
jgi:hypothetical protein